jgi:hypothetical protein
MKVLLLLTLLLQTPTPAPSKSDYEPPDPEQSIPLGSVPPDPMTLCRRYFGDRTLVSLGQDLRGYYHAVIQGDTAISVVVSRDGPGVAWLAYLGHGVGFRGELRTLLFHSRAMLSLDWFPIEVAGVSVNFDLLRGQFLPLDRSELVDVVLSVIGEIQFVRSFTR